MLVVMHPRSTEQEIQAVVERIRQLGLTPHPIPGSTRTAIGMTGNVGAVDPGHFEGMPGVIELIRVTRPYKLASREMQPEDSCIPVGDVVIGPGTFTVIAGPCSVENESMMLKTAEYLRQRGVHLLRGGVFKPRTSPYTFQGLGYEGLRILEKVRAATGMGIVTEVMDAAQVDDVAAVADMLQIGARNMQNFTLLRAVAQQSKPVLLKRGISATMEEWLMAAEYLLAGGNRNVVLCERGIRTFADHTRNTLDLSVVPAVKEASHLRLLVDPSHGTGRRTFVAPMAWAALVAGADGLLVEVHPEPNYALSDGFQSLNFAQFDALQERLVALATLWQRVIQ
jgi:3-deoxy-7-phosphoheptulonate synthase